MTRKLKEIRTQAMGLSTREFARQAGVSDRTLRSIESDDPMWQHGVRTDTIRKIGRVLVSHGISPAEVREFVEAMGEEAVGRLARSLSEPATRYEEAERDLFAGMSPPVGFKVSLPPDWVIRRGALREYRDLREYLLGVEPQEVERIDRETLEERRKRGGEAEGES